MNTPKHLELGFNPLTDLEFSKGDNDILITSDEPGEGWLTGLKYENLGRFPKKCVNLENPVQGGGKKNSKKRKSKKRKSKKRKSKRRKKSKRKY